MNPPPKDSRAVLLVEDDENDVFFFERAFHRSGSGASLHVVRDGLEAIQYLEGSDGFTDRAQHPLPALVVLDLNMPRRNGFDFLRWLRRHEALRPIIAVVLTSSSSPADIAAAYEAGANSYLLKPAEPENQLTLIRQTMAYWLGANNAPAVNPR